MYVDWIRFSPPVPAPRPLDTAGLAAVCNQHCRRRTDVRRPGKQWRGGIESVAGGVRVAVRSPALHAHRRTAVVE